MSTATPDAPVLDEWDGSTNTVLANGLAATMLAIVLFSSAPDVHLSDAWTDCLTEADVAAHEARSRHGLSLTCTGDMLAPALR